LRVPGAAADEDDVVDGGLVHFGVAQRLLHRLQRVLHRKQAIYFHKATLAKQKLRQVGGKQGRNYQERVGKLKVQVEEKFY
jgi:hypothetical protein